MNIKKMRTGILSRIYIFIEYWKRIFIILFSFQNKAYIICHPTHSNLGDQAQLMCIDQWIAENYPKHKIIHLGYFMPTLNFAGLGSILIDCISSIILLGIMQLKKRPNDIFFGHSGYFFVDHHNGYKAFIDIIKNFPKHQMIIFPQTVNFQSPYIKEQVKNSFSRTTNVTLLCRDEVSFSISKELFPHTRLMLYPDIVTSLIGTRKYTDKRDGILFCMRNDIEAFYTPEDIERLMARFGNIRKEKIDTTLYEISRKEMESHRKSIIENMIEKMASYKVVITDRYHGTIISAIASTPVIVLSSADHKLSSGVKWFPKDLFKDAVQYAENLNDAYEKAIALLNQCNRNYDNPAYFKEQYWMSLKNNLQL